MYYSISRLRKQIPFELEQNHVFHIPQKTAKTTSLLLGLLLSSREYVVVLLLLVSIVHFIVGKLLLFLRQKNAKKSG